MSLPITIKIVIQRHLKLTADGYWWCPHESQEQTRLFELTAFGENKIHFAPSVETTRFPWCVPLPKQVPFMSSYWVYPQKKPPCCRIPHYAPLMLSEVFLSDLIVFYKECNRWYYLDCKPSLLLLWAITVLVRLQFLVGSLVGFQDYQLAVLWFVAV